MFSSQCNNFSSYVHISFIITCSPGLSNSTYFWQIKSIFFSIRGEEKWFLFAFSLGILLSTLAVWACANQRVISEYWAGLRGVPANQLKTHSRLDKDTVKTHRKRILSLSLASDEWVFSMCGSSLSQTSCENSANICPSLKMDKNFRGFQYNHPFTQSHEQLNDFVYICFDISDVTYNTSSLWLKSPKTISHDQRPTTLFVRN